MTSVDPPSFTQCWMGSRDSLVYGGLPIANETNDVELSSRGSAPLSLTLDFDYRVSFILIQDNFVILWRKSANSCGVQEVRINCLIVDVGHQKSRATHPYLPFVSSQGKCRYIDIRVGTLRFSLKQAANTANVCNLDLPLTSM